MPHKEEWERQSRILISLNYYYKKNKYEYSRKQNKTKHKKNGIELNGNGKSFVFVC